MDDNKFLKDERKMERELVYQKKKNKRKVEFVARQTRKYCCNHGFLSVRYIYIEMVPYSSADLYENKPF